MLPNLQIFVAIIFVASSLFFLFNLKSVIGCVLNLLFSASFLLLFLTSQLQDDFSLKLFVVFFVLYLVANIFVILKQDEISAEQKNQKKLLNLKLFLGSIFLCFCVFISLFYATKISARNIKFQQKQEIMIGFEDKKEIIGFENDKPSEDLKSALESDIFMQILPYLILAICLFAPFLFLATFSLKI